MNLFTNNLCQEQIHNKMKNFLRNEVTKNLRKKGPIGCANLFTGVFVKQSLILILLRENQTSKP